MYDLTIRPIAFIANDYKEKFGIPRQSGIAKHLMSQIIMQRPYADPDAFRGIDSYDYLWLIFGFSENERDKEPSLTVRPPKLGGNERVGVFASRSPFRPNGLGLSCVKLERAEQTENGIVLIVSGADLLNGTPVYDIKPYVPYADSHPDARTGFSVAPSAVRKDIDVTIPFPKDMGTDQKAALLESLGQDPRPGYHEDENRIYGMRFGKWNVRFYGTKDKIVIVSFDENNK